MTLLARTGFGLIAGCCAVTLLGTATPSHADTVTLKNGREIHGRLIEEKKDSIRIRTSGGRGGTITIPKVEVATFSENENWGDYGLKPSTVSALDEKKPAEEGGGAPADEGQKPTEGEGGEGGAKSGGEASDLDTLLKNWKWAGDLSDEEIETLTEQRDKVVEAMRGLGATKEERLAAVKLTPEEDNILRSKINAFSRKRRQGSANQLRTNAMNQIVDEFGIKAIERLADSLGSTNLWISRMSAETVSKIAGSSAKAEDAKWYIQHFGVPKALLKLFDHQGEVDSPFVRQEANTALKRIFGKEFGYKESTETLRTPDETAAFKKWGEYVQDQVGVFARQESKRAEARSKLNDMLDTLREGKPVERAELEAIVSGSGE